MPDGAPSAVIVTAAPASYAPSPEPLSTARAYVVTVGSTMSQMTLTSPPSPSRKM